MIYYLIFSAGKQTRYNNPEPKALYKMNGISLLDRNFENVGNYADKRFVVCSEENSSYFEYYNKIVIESGKGCGDAVLQALLKFEFNPEDQVIIQWGDSYVLQSIHACMYKECKEYNPKYRDLSVFIPVTIEDSPYVQLKYKDPLHINVFFSKYNDPISKGYHDLSVFSGNALYIKQKLLEFQQKILVDGQYKHKHGNEMLFLDLFNETDTNAYLIPLKAPSLSFNTKEEAEKLTIDNFD